MVYDTFFDERSDNGLTLIMLLRFLQSMASQMLAEQFRLALRNSRFGNLKLTRGKMLFSSELAEQEIVVYVSDLQARLTESENYGT
jgi:hypothetical protein